MMYQRVGLGAPVGDYAMLWSPGGQMMGDGAEAFTHDGPINTAPSHDLAHLLVASASDIPWRPAGPHRQIFLAEYNAVMTEHLLDRIYRAHVVHEFAAEKVIEGLLAHGTWFTTKHFAPFPTTTQQALRQWSRGMQSETLGRLSPLFFTMKHGERSDSSFMRRTWSARFATTDRPSGWAQLVPHVVSTIRTIAS